MSSSDEVCINACTGVIVNPYGKAHFDWKISDFSFAQKADNYYESPQFSFLNAKWCIRIFSNGQRSKLSVGWVDLYLVLLQTVGSYSVNFMLGIKDPKVKMNHGPRSYKFDKEKYISGCEKVYRRDDLLKFMNGWTSLCLVVYCDTVANIPFAVNRACQTSLDSTTILSLCRDFQDLLLSGQNSDVVIEVNNHIFKAHKLILQARSSVFAKMFEHDRRDRSDKIIQIDDCNPDIFQEFLQYLYTGSIEHLTRDNVIGMFMIADKYSVAELKEHCSGFIAEDLCVDTACDVFVVADRLNEAELKTFAEKLLVQNMKTILPTEKWRLFMVENSVLAVEVLMKFASVDSALEEQQESLLDTIWKLKSKE